MPDPKGPIEKHKYGRLIQLGFNLLSSAAGALVKHLINLLFQ